MIGMGIIGMGYTGWQHLRVADEVAGVEVRAVVEARADRLAGLPPGIATHASWQEAVADPRLDALSVCLPHHLHAEVVLAALAAGKHVLVEKPLALDLPQAEQMTAAAEASSAVTMVEMTHRFYPPVVQARALARSGRLGQVVAVAERIVQPIREGELPAWMLDRAQAGGGVATTNGVHMLDRIAWVCGQPLRLHHGILGHTQHLGDVEDTASLLLSLADQTPVSLLASWPRGNGATDDELTLYGTGGILRIWAWRGWAFEPGAGPPEVHVCYPEEADHAARARVGMTGALTEFVSAIAEGRRAGPAFREILEVQRLLDRLYRSAGIA